MFKSIFPFDQSVVAEFPLMSDRAISTKLEASTKAFKSWRNVPFEERRTLMRKAATLLRENKDSYASTITKEMGKILKESQNEIEKCAAGAEYFADHAAEFLKDIAFSTEATKSFVAFQPTGAILAIMPWNFPFWQVFRFAAPTLMAGNVALLKHAPNVTQCALLIEKIFLEAGFPEGVFQTLVIDVDKVEPIIQHEIVHGVALTGSEFAGSSVAGIAGKNIKKTVLELGGSDPFIVLDDADLEKAARIATQSRMQNAGQSCIAAKRFIVVKKVKEEFIALFKTNIEKLVQGNPFTEGVTMGPLARVDLAEKLEKQLHASIKSGANLLVGGSRDGCNVRPMLLDNVKEGMTTFNEETFGPLAAVIAVADEREAIRTANASRYGLGAAIWTKDLDKAERLSLEIESGSVFVNSLMRSDARLPFGGIKKSGYGRELAENGIKEFVNTKTIFIDRS
jgi:succinate-semialdehyde dehydrogenase/glutarate-semialdehyde dehydrogenase